MRICNAQGTSPGASSTPYAAPELRLAESGHDPIRAVRLADIRPSPENDRIYRPIDPSDPEILRLAESLSLCGVQEPLLITRDGWIVSGHRRYAAARLAGLREVPCCTTPVSRTTDPDGFLRLLRECNRQRVKSFDEKLREQVVSSASEDAYQELLSYRQRQARVGGDRVGAFRIEGRPRRARISRAKEPMLAAVQQVLVDLAAFVPLSARQIHYALLNDPPLRHASKPGSAYRNDRASYKSLLELLTRARLSGRVPIEKIADETRPVQTWDIHADVDGYIADELEIFLRGYRRDLLISQPNHVELVAEKNTVAPVVLPVARDYCVPTTIGRGYCSLPPRAAMVSRYRRSGKHSFLLLVVSDFDPDGEEIAQSLARSLRDDFGIERIEPVKVALTGEQVERFALRTDAKAKPGSAHRRKFTDRHGSDVYELEALAPRALQAVLRQSITSVLDLQALDRERQQERADAGALATARRTVHEALLDRTGGRLG